MSYWIYRRGPKGQQSLYLVEVSVTLVIAVLGLMAALVLPRYLVQPSRLYSDGAALMGIGWTMVLLAKIHLFRKGTWVSWGSRLMTKPYSILYKMGYVVLIAGVIVTTMAFLANI